MTDYSIPQAMTGGLSKGLSFFSARVGHVLRSVLKHFQYARMCSALCAMSDSELKAIGLERSDIPEHAAKLVDLDA